MTGWTTKREGGQLLDELSEDEYRRLNINVKVDDHAELMRLVFQKSDAGSVMRYLLDRTLHGDIEIDWHEVKKFERR